MTVQTDAKTYLNFINGEWKAGSSNEVIESISPANRHQVVGRVQKSTKEDLDQAVAAAKSAEKAWRNLSGAAR
jgi:acyl-CoA reductase-like NAD-dependent aldehyde dehydrogenase